MRVHPGVNIYTHQLLYAFINNFLRYPYMLVALPFLHCWMPTLHIQSGQSTVYNDFSRDLARVSDPEYKLSLCFYAGITLAVQAKTITDPA